MTFDEIQRMCEETQEATLPLPTPHSDRWRQGCLLLWKIVASLPTEQEREVLDEELYSEGWDEGYREGRSARR